MTPYSLFFCLAGVALEGLLLARALWIAWYKKYPIFFLYVTCVFFQDALFPIVYVFNLHAYRTIYWYGEFLSLLIGCGVSWEIFRLVLARFPGAGRMARNVLLVALIIVVAKVLIDGGWSSNLPWPAAAIELERNLRAVQALSLIVLAALSGYYQVPINRNVKGIFVGYGLFIAMNVMTLTLRAFLGASFQAAWIFLQPLCYAGVLILWCLLLWNYEPAPAAAPELQPRLEKDYRSLALATRKSLLQTRALLGKAIRP